MRTLRCIDKQGRPVAAIVAFQFLGVASCLNSRSECDGNGDVIVPTPAGITPQRAVIVPYYGHWNTVVDDPYNVPVCVCEAMSPETRLWWRKLVGRKTLDSDAGNRIKIGVIDLPFKETQLLDHVVRLDVEGMALSERGLPDVSHGQAVCKVIGQRGPVLSSQGIAPGSEILFVDVSEEDDHGTWDSDKMVPAIELLVDLGADIINISGGIASDVALREPDTIDAMRSALEYAAEGGTIVVAAVGNDSKASPALPSFLSEVIGVGGIGQSGIAPASSDMGNSEAMAAGQSGCIGHLGALTLFHHDGSSWGKGVDVVAPSVGISLHGNQQTAIEWKGTSFAAPIVSSVLAVALSGDEFHRDATGLKRTNRARVVLDMCCESLGNMDKLRQGRGLPVVNRTQSH